jgi:hypothetical protein
MEMSHRGAAQQGAPVAIVSMNRGGQFAGEIASSRISIFQIQCIYAARKPDADLEGLRSWRRQSNGKP